jgi:hypothetical protein
MDSNFSYGGTDIRVSKCFILDTKTARVPMPMGSLPSGGSAVASVQAVPNAAAWVSFVAGKVTSRRLEDSGTERERPVPRLVTLRVYVFSGCDCRFVLGQS